ncbi:MAG: hypothetical protein IPM29_00810 [Planctomycetes bacterium]|nr:hypothetical protein [Planctomycetota bacterium]
MVRVPIVSVLVALAAVAAVPAQVAPVSHPPAWRDLAPRAPDGVRAHTGSFIVGKEQATDWQRPAFVYDPAVATGRKAAKVVVVIYDPVLEQKDGQRLQQWLHASDPVEFSYILADVIREASWGYVNYEIVDILHLDAYPKKVDGFRYDDDSYLAVRESKDWQPSPTSYRAVFEENGLLERFRTEGITELWMWGADGFHFDEFAYFVPDRYARFGPSDNPWLYRPYDIPEELDRTTWVMGFNIEVGADNMIHSYVHRVESIMSLAFGDGRWDPRTHRDPWNVFTVLETDFEGHPSMVGNCHVPPNGQRGYDYDNPRRVESWAWSWANYPDLRGEPHTISSWAWGKNQFGYQCWLLGKLPKGPGHTQWGYDNWWVYVANTDEDLPEWTPPAPGVLRLPDGMPPLAR